MSNRQRLDQLFGHLGWRASQLVGSDACVFDIGLMEPAELAGRLASALASSGVGMPLETNFVELGVGKLRSGTAAGLALHQEGYETPDPPRMLFLYCLESNDSSGQTLVASSRAMLDSPLRRALEATTVRFLRTSADWTPWRPLVEYRDREPLLRMALPDAHRQVETQGPVSLSELSSTVTSSQVRIQWRPGLLLAIQNWTALHGREPFTGTARKLFRLVC